MPKKYVKPKQAANLAQGIAFYNAGKFQEAVDCFLSAAERKSTPKTLYFLAHSLASSGREQEALSVFRRLDQHPFLENSQASQPTKKRQKGRRPVPTASQTQEARLRVIRMLDASAFSAQDIIALLLGDKPMAYNDAAKDQIPAVEKLANKFGLHLLILGTVKTQPQHDKKARYGLLLGKERKQMDRAAALWSSPSATWSITLGRLLGYPECCVLAYYKFNRLQQSRPHLDIVPAIAAASGPGPFPFLLNNMMVFNSRLCFMDAGDKIEKIFSANINPEVSLKLKAVITWHPCSFKCEESLVKARRIWSVLEWLSPHEAAALRDRLSSPILYLNWWEFTGFKGRIGQNKAVYLRLAPPHSLLTPKNRNLLRSGNNLRLVSGGVQVRRDKIKLGFLASDFALLLPFA